MAELLVPIDFSDNTPTVLEAAARIAKAMNLGIALLHVVRDAPHTPGAGESWHAVTVVPRRPPPVAATHMPGPPQRTVLLPVHDDPRQLARQAHLQRCEDFLRRAGIEVTARLVAGDPAGEILAEAGRLAPELIVVGSHGHGALHHLLLGSVSQVVVRKSRWPVLIVPVRT